MPAVNPSDVLSKRQLSEINKGLSSVDRAVQLCDLAESCSVDCTEKRLALEDIRQQLNAFKSTFFSDSR